MAKGFKHGAGGGSSLNFKVVGNPQPENPKENTIWIDTDTEITSWVFGTTAPEAAEGMVWVQTGTTSPAEFNALKKNSIQVYPTMAKQYVGGAWVSKTAKTYRGGAWAEWALYLYKDGNLCEGITGGWQTRGWLEGGNGSYALEPTATYGTTSVTITSSTTNSYQYTGVWEPKKDIDLTNIKTIRFHVLSATISGQYLACDFGVHNRSNGTSGSHLARVNLETSTTPKYYDLDVSNISGSYDVALRLGGGKTNISVTIDEIRLLKEGEA